MFRAISNLCGEDRLVLAVYSGVVEKGRVVFSGAGTIFIMRIRKAEIMYCYYVKLGGGTQGAAALPAPLVLAPMVVFVERTLCVQDPMYFMSTEFAMGPTSCHRT